MKRKIKIDGKVYVIQEHKLVMRYDAYYYRRHLYNVQPDNVYVIGYVKSNDRYIAICKKIGIGTKVICSVGAKVMCGAFIALLCVGSVYMVATSFKEQSLDISWEPKVFKEPAPTLPTNIVKEGKLEYNKYVIYEDGKLYPYVFSKKGQVQFKIGDVTSDTLDADNVSILDMHLDMKEEDIREGTIIYHLDGNVSEYQIIVECPAHVVYTPLLVGESYYVEESTEASSEPDFRTYQETDTDYENWSVIGYGDYYE